MSDELEREPTGEAASLREADPAEVDAGPAEADARPAEADAGPAEVDGAEVEPTEVAAEPAEVVAEPTEPEPEVAADEPGAPTELAVEPSFTSSLNDAEIERLVPALLEAEAEPEPTAPREGPRADAAASPASPRRPPPKSLFGLLRPNGAVILLGLVCALAVVEAIAAFIAYREGIRDEDWRAVERLLAAESEPGEPVLVASEWLGPSARMQLERVRSWDSLGRPDLRGVPRFFLLAHASERPWRGPLEDELEQLRRPELIAVHQFGDLALHEYRQPVGALKFSLLDSIQRVSTGRGRCSGSVGRYRCKDGRVEIRPIEVDYRVRRCLVVELDDGVMAEVELGQLDLGDRIYGHVGFGDFNARLRADPVARLELLLDDAVVGRWVFTDDQRWASFALATPPGRHRVALRVGTTAAGTWQREGHRDAPTDSLCVELRGFDESQLPTKEGGA